MYTLDYAPGTAAMARCENAARCVDLVAGRPAVQRIQEAHGRAVPT